MIHFRIRRNTYRCFRVAADVEWHITFLFLSISYEVYSHVSTCHFKQVFSYALYHQFFSIL